jgi:ketosteroid isomerase-like protein
MTTVRTAGFDVETLRRGVEGRDADALTSLYADDAECILIDKSNPPGRPREFRGKEAIAEFNRDLTSRDMTHRLDKIVVSGDSGAYADACEYPDGTRVYCAAMLDLKDDKIARQVCVQAWDE